jgi:thiamine pyrophosphokinase
MKSLIISSGKIENLKLLEELVSDSDYIVCADGGVDNIRKIDKTPDLVIGDFDSISNEGFKFINERNIKREKFSKMKDKTDTQLAIDILIERGFTDITITGVTGSRMDHTLANIFLLKDLKKRDINSKIVDDNNIIYIVDDVLELPRTDNYISLVPISSKGIIVSLKGFLYTIDKKYMPFGSTMGISNEIKEDLGIVQIHSGQALLFESRD